MFDRRLYPESLLEYCKRRTKNSGTVNQTVPKFIFLCGEKPSAESKSIGRKTNREEMIEYLPRLAPNVVVLLAETLWAGLKLNLLTFEHFMAQISDLVLMFLEGPGTIAELGAFASVDNLIPKLLVFNDKRYRHVDSFITSGPLAKISENSSEGVIYGNLDTVLESQTLYNRLVQLNNDRKSIKPNKPPNDVDFVNLIYELLDLIGLIGPVRLKDLLSIYKFLRGFEEFFKLILPGTNTSVTARYAVDFLRLSSLVREQGGYLYFSSPTIKKNICLLEMTSYEFQCLRSKFIARKMKYLGLSQFDSGERKLA